MNTSNSTPPAGTPPLQTPHSSPTPAPASVFSLVPPSNNIQNGLPAVVENPSRQTVGDVNNHRNPTSSLPSSRRNSRYNPPVPSRMTGTYSSNNSIYHGNLGTNINAFRRGTCSASNSPPGTPPNGLRDYYLNAAFHRSQHRLYAPGSASSSTTNLQSLQRPALSVMVPSRNNITVPHATLARRSYSAGHLGVEEPEITVTTPGGSNATEDHVMTLQNALNNLIEQEGRITGENDDPEDTDAEGQTITDLRKYKSGVSLTPKVLANRLDSEVEATATNHGIVGPDAVALDGIELSEMKKKQKHKDKKRSNRFSRLFFREPHHMAADADLARESRPSARPTVQPSKAGVLSNLLKLQDSGRHHKHQHHTSSLPKPHKEKKKRHVLYSRSANNSATSVATKSIFNTYPPLPTTSLIPQGSTTGLTNLANFNAATHRNGNANQRHSFQFDYGFPAAFPPGVSPLQSPNGSPRGSFSYDNDASATPTLYSLSAEEKMRITFAVADILQRQDYVLRLARAMIKFGAPSHRLEDAVDHTARTLELNLQCVYMPNVMIIAFTDYETHTSETHLLKVSAGLNMYKFAQVHKILKLVAHSSMPVDEAIMKLDTINAEKDLWPQWANVLSYALASFCAAPMFFKGNWVDAGVAFLIGGLVGVMNWISQKVPSYAHICEITMSVVVAFVAEALHSHVCRSAVKMAGIVMLLPGYTITCSILELSSRHMISGSVRLFYAIIFSLLLGYGLTIGASLWNLFDPSSRAAEVTAACPQVLDPKWNILFVPLFSFTLNVWLKAHPRQWVLAIILSILGYMISYSTATWAGAKNEVSSALASFAIGFCGNIYQRVTHQLSFQAVVCAVFFLVPGSMGLKGAMAWLTDDMAGGVNFALQMVITAIAISVGLFASALVVYPTGKARSAQMTF
ncbi:hypothetical protein BGZ51_009112 [Haplosporangium sp. Z 767]|nr:hypothetical protein BGZ51_009112 [Haplosporangium sp. Z 767]KAF9197085.1 hypothetical protein BGZ50_000035 [Haplosporangium sp. Z 11]